MAAFGSAKLGQNSHGVRIERLARSDVRRIPHPDAGDYGIGLTRLSLSSEKERSRLEGISIIDRAKTPWASLPLTVENVLI